jgi:cytoskeletal protein RodZ
MKTIGNLLHDARVQKKYSLEKLENITKIKKEFISNIENEKWIELPEFPVTQGFIISVAKTLGLNSGRVKATLRRDYPPKSLDINPKPDVEKGFKWSPKFTYVAIVALSTLLVLGYLTYQYFNFIKVPELEVYEPKDETVVRGTSLLVSGKTDEDAVVYVNNQPALVADNGNFETTIEIFAGTNEIEIKAKSRYGKESVIRRKIVPELESTK